MQRRKATANIVNGMRAIHPGEVLREEFLLPLGLTANALAIALQVPAPRINDVAREKRGVSADTALRSIADAGTSSRGSAFSLLSSESGRKRDMVSL